MSTNRRGSALLTVLWLTAALSAVALALSATVRGETERATTAVESTRARYLAAGSIDRAILHMQWGGPRYHPGQARFVFEYPTGSAVVEIIPETAKLNLNSASADRLTALLVALSVDPIRARAIADAIVDWRSPAGPNLADQFYLAQSPSFRPRHASFEETEELLWVRGMTPDIYYGTYITDPQGRFASVGGLRDCVSVFGATDRFDANYAQPAVLASAGFSAPAIERIVAQRTLKPFESDAELQSLTGDPRLRTGGNSIFTLRATARPRTGAGTLGDLRRTVSAMVKFMPPGYDSSIHILRWSE